LVVFAFAKIRAYQQYVIYSYCKGFLVKKKNIPDRNGNMEVKQKQIWNANVAQTVMKIMI